MLTDTALRNLKPKSLTYKASDRDGMYVTVSPTGTVTFRFDYRLNGRRETLTIGRYGPAGISLGMAREKLLDAKKAVAQGKSPAHEKQREKRRLTAAKNFGDMTAQWLAGARMAYPALSRLAQVAPLDMSQQMFLARCKSLHEVWQRVPNGYLKSLLEGAGCPRAAVKDLGSLKLLQALLNVIERLNAHEEASDAFASGTEPEGWRDRSEALAPLFLNNDLRIADAHEAVEQCLATLQRLGFDTANVNAGYGRALDFVMDGVIDALETVAAAIGKLLRLP